MRAGHVAARLGVTTRTVQRWAAAGILPGRRTPGGHWRFTPTDIEVAAAAATTRNQR